mmetsp:Transcript_61430/g.114032  ORF Transcript_61430/g.114032 Transcript_61430/m.114032 type:complete len:263 (-) Transcript_61430:328-1116(-)
MMKKQGRATTVTLLSLLGLWLFGGSATFAAPAALRCSRSALRGSSAPTTAIQRQQADARFQTTTIQVVEPQSFKMGAKRKGVLTAAVAAFAAFTLHTADALTKASWGLPLWAGPSAGVCVMFAVAAVAAAEEGKIQDFAGITKYALQVGMGVTGSCAFAVFVCSQLPSVVLRRTVAVGIAALWMLLNPFSAVFPPSAGYCALYIDQLLVNGPMAKLSYMFSVFPCGVGVMVVLLSSRIAAGFGVQPVRLLSRWARAVKSRYL